MNNINIEPLIPKLPLVRAWIQETLIRHNSAAKPLSNYPVPRLSSYFSQPTLDAVRVVVVPKLPIPPLSALGLSQFKDYENGNYAAITYLNTYFMLESYTGNGGTHFHEIVHTVQWKYLGMERFIIAYAVGLIQHGYRNSPLEAMAYKYEQKFKTGIPFKAEDEIITEINTSIIPTLPKLP